MVDTTHITFRAGEDLYETVDDIAERYGMNRSQLLRLVVGKSVREIEADGLDGFVEDAPGQDGEETDDSIAGQLAD